MKISCMTGTPMQKSGIYSHFGYIVKLILGAYVGLRLRGGEAGGKEQTVLYPVTYIN